MPGIGSIAAAMLGLLAATPAAATVPDGLWVNPHHSVAVQTGPCGERVCGWVVWASADATADARDAGVDPLIGKALLEDYRADGKGGWTGTVFVPDMNRRFASQIDALSPQTLKIKGCILGGLICKSQIWTRIGAVPHG